MVTHPVQATPTPSPANAQVSSRTRTSRPRVRLETCAFAKSGRGRPGSGHGNGQDAGAGAARTRARSWEEQCWEERRRRPSRATASRPWASSPARCAAGACAPSSSRATAARPWSCPSSWREWGRARSTSAPTCSWSRGPWPRRSPTSPEPPSCTARPTATGRTATWRTCWSGRGARVGSSSWTPRTRCSIGRGSWTARPTSSSRACASCCPCPTAPSSRGTPPGRSTRRCPWARARWSAGRPMRGSSRSGWRCSTPSAPSPGLRGPRPPSRPRANGCGGACARSFSNI